MKRPLNVYNTRTVYLPHNILQPLCLRSRKEPWPVQMESCQNRVKQYRSVLLEKETCWPRSSRNLFSIHISVKVWPGHGWGAQVTTSLLGNAVIVPQRFTLVCYVMASHWPYTVHKTVVFIRVDYSPNCLLSQTNSLNSFNYVIGS